MRKHSIIDGDVPDCTNMPKEESLNHVREENCTDLFLYVYYHPLSLLLWIQLLNFSYMVHECSKVYWKQYYRLLLLWATIVLSMSSILSRLTKVSSITQCIWCTNIWSYRVYHPQMVIKPVRLCSSIWSATNLKWCIK